MCHWVTLSLSLSLPPPQLEKAYTNCAGHRGDLKTHLTQTGANSRKISQTMESYGYMMCTLTFQATEVQKLKEQAETDVKKV